MTERLFFRNGQIERGTGKPGFRWVQGYSQLAEDGKGVYFPSLTRREAQQDARRDGVRARFFDSQADAAEYYQNSAK